eukprot:scaffold7279_cov175-Amphora_coffeaeformis.AAC.4
MPRYPENVDDIIRYGMVPGFQRFLETRLCRECFDFYLATDPRGNINVKNIYNAFLRDGAAYEINAHGELLQQARALGSRNKWNDPAWPTLLHEFRTEQRMLLDTNYLVRDFVAYLG